MGYIFTTCDKMFYNKIQILKAFLVTNTHKNKIIQQ